MGIDIPYDCPRGRKDCIALANIKADDGSSFFCCGENNGQPKAVEQDIFTTCFKGDYRDEINHHDKRDLIHQASVIVQALAVVEKHHDHEDDQDWSPWTETPIE